jgi:hypothetical protein
MKKYALPQKQRGNGLVLALLGAALVSAVTAQGFKRDLVQAQRHLGEQEATVQQRLAVAVNATIQDNLQALQQRATIPAGGAPAIAPATVGLDTFYTFSIDQLKGLTALPSEWSTTASPTTGGNYSIQVRLFPTGCLLVACGVEGSIQNGAPLLHEGAPNGPGLGVFSDKIGADSGITRAGTAATLTGWGNTWSAPNRTAGNPAGIMAMRVGTTSVGFSTFLRVRDTRDPDFQSGTTVSGLIPGSTYTLQINGAANIGGSLTVGGTSTFNGPTTFNDDIVLRDPGTGLVCIRILRAGQIDVNCNGVLNAKAGTFTGPNGTVKVGTTGTQYAVDTTGKIRGDQGFFAAVGSVFGDNTLGIRAASSVFTVQTASGVDAVAVHDDGRFGGRNSVATPMLGLSDSVVADSPCSSAAGEVASTQVTSAAATALRALSGGGLATCINSRWVPIANVVQPGTVCAVDGALAISATDSKGLTCRNGVWMLLNDLLSPYVLVDTKIVYNGNTIAKPTCGQMGASTGQAYPYLMAQNEGSSNASFTRTALDNGVGGWVIRLNDSLGNPLVGVPAASAILLSMCFY